jgi:uncharacterized membrane protein YedE/YeeE
VSAKHGIAAFLSGVVFAIGLAVAGMTRPSNVIGFLDLFGEWRPALMFVMVSGIAVSALAFRWARSREAPLFAPRFALPTRRDLDARLIAGSAIFGIGWGLGGYCPGPAVTSLATGSLGPLVFVLAMLGGMFAVARLERAVARSREDTRLAAESVEG